LLFGAGIGCLAACCDLARLILLIAILMWFAWALFRGLR
jgi:hypothetical protein